MPSKKQKVSLFLEPEEAKALEEFKSRNEVGNSEAITWLLKEYGQDDYESFKDLHLDSIIEERISRLEKTVDNAMTMVFRTEQNNGKLQEQIAEIQCELESLITKLKDEGKKCLSDEQIAAVTCQPEWKVKLWRHGVQKPRGKNIKAKLLAYEVKDGSWKKRG